MTDDLNVVLARLDAWLEANAPADHAALNPPAAQDDIDAIADRRFSLHPELVMWLGRHDGVAAAKGHGGPGVILPQGFILHAAEGMRAGQRSMEEAIAEWVDENESEDPDLRDIYDGVYGYAFHARWVPIASDITGGKLIVDHRDGERFGNVLYGLHGGDTEGPDKVWNSLSHMFRDLLDALTGGTEIRLPGYADPVTPHLSGTGDDAFVRWE
ncbi:SMI1/KNR4 family protein [Streptomyces sp. NBC_01450]|jgi:cell wall assembly regulator SMI1|uniref:SMI1/KNR4 family protein n=1 Tax=Streptomyces sp. NBC_01450 TaxID=2903871 RepID=UPI002E2ED79C|nr:SMI1/KNR4 family protein [Streptomyces sp. NBC_01450]